MWILARLNIPPNFQIYLPNQMTFFSGQTRSNQGGLSNKCIFWNFVIDFVLKEIKNAKNIIVCPFYRYFKQRPVSIENS